MKKQWTVLLALFLLNSCHAKNQVPSNSFEEPNYQESISSAEIDEKEEEKQYYHFNEIKSIYINPSVQYTNAYAASLGNEGEHMNEIATILYTKLSDTTNLNIYGNFKNPGLSLSQSIKESNSLKMDYHIALHSNAGGGKGSEGWYNGSNASYELTSSILDSLQEILPYPTRGLKNGGSTLYELKNSNATSTLLEILFHDNVDEATYILENKEAIANAIYKGIIHYLK